MRVAFAFAASCLLLFATADDIESLSKFELVARVRRLESELRHESTQLSQQQPAAGEQLWPELMKTPFMMWNGWLPSTRGLIPGQANNETLYYAAADRLVASGLRDAGYDTIAVTCNGWQRDPVTGQLRADPKTWPNGYKALVDYLHARKLKICAYSDTGATNCCGEPGILGHEEQDIRQLADWGVDHIAVDNCANPNTTAQSIFEYQRVHDALVKVGKPMIFGIWNVGSGKPWTWAPQLGHYWRTGPDLGTKWEGRPVPEEGGDGILGDEMSIMLNFDLQQSIPSLDSISGPGSFALLDNLALGLPPDVPHRGDPGLSVIESQTHMAIWCIMASPLIINYNIFDGPGRVDPEIEKIVMHDEAIAINQDPLGKSAVRIDGAHSWSSLLHRLPFATDMWDNGVQLAKPLANGDVAVLLFNRANTTKTITLDFVDVGNTSLACWAVRDIWNRTNLGRFNGTFQAKDVPPHGNRFLRLSAGDVCPLQNGGGPVGPACTPPAAAPQGFTLHTERGWYGNLSTMKEIGRKGEMTLENCAESCRTSTLCLAFHSYFAGGGNCSGLKGDCYIHSAPVGAFVGGNSRAILYDRDTPLPVKSDDDGVLAAKLMKLSFSNAATPFLPPNRSSTFDSTVCMNPNIIKVGSTWRLYYAGADEHSTHRIALATAPVTGPTPANAVWTRRGVVLGTGKPGKFNSAWSVLPLVKKFGDLWHLYFTGRSSSGCPYTNNTGLQSFWGIGLATSTDGLHFTQHSTEPIILGNATKAYPNNYGVAGGGSLIEDGAGGYRFYYTLAVGTTSHDVKVDQKKVCAVAHSQDGIHFYNHSVVMGPLSTSEQPREDVACAAPVVWRDAAGIYRMVYSAIGTKWGFYSLAQAASTDGYSWYRGDERTDQDLILAPANKSSWDSQMVEYASVWTTSSRLGLFYAGNGYGKGGIGYTESPVGGMQTSL